MMCDRHGNRLGAGGDFSRCRLLLPLAGCLALLNWPALAQDISGAEIERRLSGNSVLYEDGARQSFAADGATRYQSAPGRPVERGRWRVRDDQYCSRWGGGFSPGAGAETCYTVQYDGQTITFNGDYPGAIQPGDIFKEQ